MLRDNKSVFLALLLLLTNIYIERCFLHTVYFDNSYADYGIKPMHRNAANQTLFRHIMNAND